MRYRRLQVVILETFVETGITNRVAVNEIVTSKMSLSQRDATEISSVSKRPVQSSPDLKTTIECSCFLSWINTSSETADHAVKYRRRPAQAVDRKQGAFKQA